MKSTRTLILAVVVTACATFFATVLGIYFFVPSFVSSVYPDAISQIRSYIDRHAIFDFSEEDAEKNAILGYISGLDDEYGYYWTAEEYAKRLSSNEGNFTGIGISLRATDPISEGLFVYRVIGNSPAQVAGLKAGDLITAVNGKTVDGCRYADVSADIRVQLNSIVEFTVQRGDETKTFSVEFKNFVQSYVDSRMIGTVGYIRIHSFTKPAVAEFDAAMEALISQGATGFIFDLRNNLGGSIYAVEEILDGLVPKNEEIVVIQYNDSEEIHTSGSDPITTLPMVVLMNKSSASGSELMASCLRDLNSALLVGTPSFGKGIGQTTFRLSDGSAFKLTTFHYLTKARVYYHGVGLQPDLTVELTEEQEKYFYALSDEEDPQLQAALAALKP